ncbi:bacillithiol system redox-active protein YtxJ [Paenibacillus sp. M1]|uniref:Bacillithiol system redox-active protein YtxJ n=1 Tax=Paenibacillus haidiansis TaxID=1574488 RepID=A0ABU7VLD5_9BACL
MTPLVKITSKEELRQALDDSANRPLLLFKHSTRCPISAGARRELEGYLNGDPNEQITYRMIYVIENREVSNEAESALGVKHESPQALLVKDGRAVWHSSHSNITAVALQGILV